MTQAATDTRMNIELASGAVLLLERADQVPPGVVLEPILVDGVPMKADPHTTIELARDEAGRLRYREVHPQRVMEALVKTLAVELDAAATSLTTAAGYLKDGHCTPYKASQIHQAAERARQAWLGITQNEGPGR